MDETTNNGNPTVSVGTESGNQQGEIRNPIGGTRPIYPGDGTAAGQTKDKSNTPLNLQSPLISTRSRKEKSIDNDLLSIASGLEAVSMGVFVDDTYASDYYKAAIGQIISLDKAEVAVQEPIDASVGYYLLSQENGSIITSGNGTGLVVSVNIKYIDPENEEEGLKIGVEIGSGGQGFAVEDVLIINTTSIGGLNEQETIVLTLTEGCLDYEITSSSFIKVSAIEGIVLSSDTGIIRLTNITPGDPGVQGALWMDRDNGYVLKVSQGKDRNVLG
jgi:hypothetical protein